ncbi:hypothetical protein LIER_38248 [Lithospermum erythrorhizon]|uniref:Uncharacterized protein n=1 Tax=Lithospermum erythrorhizon TaxID=34254 RepID=A0AAV3Q100_LITER
MNQLPPSSRKLRVFMMHLSLLESNLPTEVFLLYILRGLRDEFRDLKPFIYGRGSQITFEELHNYLLTHEFVNCDAPGSSLVSTQGLLPTPPPIAHYAQYDPPNYSRDRGRYSRGRFHRGIGINASASSLRNK